MSRIRLTKYAKIFTSLLVTAALMVVLLVVPNDNEVYSLTATVTTSKGDAATFNLGEHLVFPITLAFDGEEAAPQSMTIEVTGGGNLPFAAVTVPLIVGTHDLSSGLPAGAILPTNTYNSTSGNVSLSATVVMTNMIGGWGYGVGGYSTNWPNSEAALGYGYKGLSGGGTIVATVTYKPPVLLYPPPAAASGPLASPTLKFSTDTGTTTTTVTAIPSLPGMKMKNQIPPIPQSMPSADKRGFYVDATSQTQAVLVNGFSGQGDTIGFFGTGNFMNFKGFVQPSMSEITDEGGNSNDLEGVVITGTSSGNVTQVGVLGGLPGETFFALINANGGSIDTFGNSSLAYVNLNTQFNGMEPGGLAYDETNNKVYAISWQSDIGQSAALVAIDLNDGSVATANVSLGGLGVPCCSALTWSTDDDLLTGVGMDSTTWEATLYTFDTSGGFQKIQYPYNDDGGNFFAYVYGMGWDDQGDDSGSDNYVYLLEQSGTTYYGVKSAVETTTYGQVGDMPIAISVDPQANVAYIVFDGNPNDGMRVLDLSQGSPANNPLREWSYGSQFVESAVFIPGSGGGTDYIWNIDSGNCSSQKLQKRDINDGTVVSEYTLPGYVSCDIGGMDQDPSTGNILIIEKYSDTIHSIDSVTGQAISQQSLWDQNAGDMFYPPGGAESLAVETIDGEVKILLGKQNKLFMIGWETNPGGILGGFQTPLMDVTGLGGGTVGTVWLADKSNKKIYQASLPGATSTETTTAGNYGAAVVITPAPTNASTNWSTTFTLAKVSSLTLTITSPTDGSGVAAAALDSDGKMAITGTINDHSVKTVSFGATLGVTTLVGAPPSAPTAVFNLETTAETSVVSSSATNATTDWEITGLWNVVTATNAPGGNKYKGGAGFYYGQVSGSNAWSYETGSQTTGNLDTPTFSVGAGTKLSFNTYYFTEPSFDWDQKTVQFCTSSSSCSTLLQIVDMPPPPSPPYFQMPNPGFVFSPSMVGANWGEFSDGRQFVFIPMQMSGGTDVEIPLSKTLGTGFLRFKFDSKDPWMNDFEGWYVDNLLVIGAGGAAGVGFAVDNGAWAGLFAPAEGENKVTVAAAHTAYDTSIQGVATTISVYLDTVAPVVAFDTISLPTKVVSGSTVYVTGDSFLQDVISGTFNELVPDTLELFTLTNTSITALAALNVFTDADAKNVLSKKTFDKSSLATVAAVDAITIDVVDASGFAVGDKLRIGTGDQAEVVTITAIASEDVTFSSDDKLEYAHDAEETVAQIDWKQDLNLGTTDSFIKLGLKLADSGGLTATQEVVLALDTTAPTLAVSQVVYPIGATSARGNDELIFDVTAADALSGVAMVLVVAPSGGNTLSSDSAINDTTVTLENNTFSATDVIIIDSGNNAEARTVSSIATSGSSSTLTLDKKLKKIHLSGAAVAEGTALLSTSGMPDLVTGKYAIGGTHVAFATVPSGTPAGEFAINVAVSDTGGNTKVATATGTITASLQAANFYVMPGGNLLGMNLQPTYPSWADILAQEISTSVLDSSFVAGVTLASTTTSAATAAGATTVTVASVTNLAVNDGIKIGSESRRILSISSTTLTLNRALSSAHSSGATVAEYVSLANLTKAVFYFTGGSASTGTWQTYTPSVAVDTLTLAKQGRAYWLFLEDDAFKTSTPLAGFTTGTSIPISVVIAGVLFDASAEPPSLPTTVSVVAGWNLISLISEQDRTVEQGARGLMFPTQTFTSMAEYQKFVNFDSSNSEVTIVEGVFNPLFTGTGTEDMKVGRGFYVFMSEADTHTP